MNDDSSSSSLVVAVVVEADNVSWLLVALLVLVLSRTMFGAGASVVSLGGSVHVPSIATIHSRVTALMRPSRCFTWNRCVSSKVNQEE